jgi:CheY-like chemotaxis protein
MVVDDERQIREVLGICLAEDGHKVEFASEGAEALAKFEKNKFDLLLTDYSMPNMNGDRLSAAVRERDPNIRIALLTGFGSQLPLGAPLRLEVDAILAKPFTFQALRQGIAEAMRG